MKAWFIEDPWVDDCWNVEERGQYQIVVHAETRNTARSEGWKRIGEPDTYIALRVRRCPCLDDLPLTDWNLYAVADWHVPCQACERLMDSDRWDYEDDVSYAPVEGRHGEAFCSQRCKDSWERIEDHSCWIGWRGVLTPSGEQAIVPVPFRKQDEKQFAAMWRIVDANQSGYWKMGVPA